MEKTSKIKLEKDNGTIFIQKKTKKYLKKSQNISKFL